MQNSDRLSCDICNLEYIHRNDFENHIRSRKHIQNTRKPNRQEVKGMVSRVLSFPEDVLTTSMEGTSNFANFDLFSRDSHMKYLRKDVMEEDHGQCQTTGRITKKGSAKARRKLLTKSDDRYKKSTSHLFSFLDNINAQPVTAQEEENVEDEKEFCRRKFKIRPDYKSFQRIESYVYSIVSFLSVKMSLDPTITDFNISVNDKRYQLFGDIVIHIINDDKYSNYAIRCKEISMIQKHIDNLKDAKIYIEKEFDFIRALKNQKNFGITKFLLYTTCTASSNFQKEVDYSITENDITNTTKLKIVPCKKDSAINVSSEIDNVYSIFSEDSKLELQPLFLYTNQRVFLPVIDELLKRRFESFPSVYQEYHSYIENWARGSLGGNYLLTKKDVILKLGELLLGPYIILPKVLSFKEYNFDLWYKITQKVDVIIVKTEPFVLTKICQPFSQMIERTLSVKFDSVTKTATVTNDMLSKLGDPKIKAYFFEEEKVESDVYFTKIFKVFWKAGKIPLSVSLENSEDSKIFILDVISFMKSNGVHKKFLLKSEVPFQFFRKPPDNLKIFACLDDVKQYIDLNEIKIKLTKGKSLPLSRISANDPFFLKWITPSIFIDMVLNKYTLKKDECFEFDMQSDLKIILDDETQKWVHSLLYEDCNCEENSLGRLRGIDPNLF